MKQKISIFAIFFLLLNETLLAQKMPDNAHMSKFGSGWVCDHGYRKVGQQCEKIIVPENAHLTPKNPFDFLNTGSGWECNKGYIKSNGKCLKIAIPDHASLNQLGNGWVCDHGYRKVGQQCEKIIVPENAHLTPKNPFDFLNTGSGWECDKGYIKKKWQM